MLGSGIYALIGRAAGEVGNAVWLAFLVAMVAAMLTALSYASLASRYPRAGGAAFVTERAYRSRFIGFVTGFAVVASALSSVATQSRVFAENLLQLLGLEQLPASFLAVAFVLLLSGIVLRGIGESVAVNMVCTLVEAAGLLLVIVVAVPHWGSVNLFETPRASGGVELLLLLFQGAVLTFFAFIGFEDSFNVAEECRDPQRTLPIGIVTSLAVGAALYIAVAISAVSVVHWGTLSEIPAPLAAVVEEAGAAAPPLVLTAITLFAVANTALVNYVTGSRLLYGMAQQGLIPTVFGRIHRGWHTPYVAILALLIIILPLAALGDITDLAAATVLMLLGVFLLMNGALFILKARAGELPGALEVPRWVPALGALVCAALILARVASGDWGASVIAAGMLSGIVVLYWLTGAVARGPGVSR
jgi:amino acid transporter